MTTAPGGLLGRAHAAPPPGSRRVRGRGAHSRSDNSSQATPVQWSMLLVLIVVRIRPTRRTRRRPHTRTASTARTARPRGRPGRFGGDMRRHHAARGTPTCSAQSRNVRMMIRLNTGRQRSSHSPWPWRTAYQPMYHAPRAGPRAAGTGFGITVGFQIPHGARRRDRRPGRTARNDAAPNGEQRQPHADSSLNF